jgi:5-(carboxyamino)imidazole ribonucleotide synthase
LSREALDIGILGAGQLARMLAEAALTQGFSVGVFSDRSTNPACIRHVEVFLDLEALCARAKKIIFESEFVDVSKLRRVKGGVFFPSLDAIESLQDKEQQKCIFKTLHIPSAHFIEADQFSEKFYLKQWVFKMARHGYDGKGNFVFRGAQDLERLKEFIRLAKDRQIRVFAEEWIDFESELAITGCRLNGETSFFPLVKTVQEKGVCKWVRGPAVEWNIDPEVEGEARKVFQNIAEHLSFEGVLSVEFFYHPQRGLLVNELAPRVHNSAHYSLVASSSSQFEVQVVAAAADRLLHPETQEGVFGMFNLISPLSQGTLSWEGGLQKEWSHDFQVYWYGKKELSWGRKMGHIVYHARDRDELKRIERSIVQWEQSFWKNLSREKM